MRHLSPHPTPHRTAYYRVAEQYKFLPQSVSRKTIMITGAANGIGRALAISLGKAGADLIVLDKDEKGLETLADTLIKRRVKKDPLLIPLDLATLTEDMAASLAEQLHEAHSRIDGLVHLAGMLGELTPLSQYPPYLWRQVWATHMDAVFLLTQALTPHLRAAPLAQVILTSADEGLSPRAYWGAYSVSKAALQTLAQVWADEWRNTSTMRVNVVNPGPVATEQRRQAFPAEDPTQLPKPKEALINYQYLLGDADPELSGATLLPPSFAHTPA